MYEPTTFPIGWDKETGEPNRFFCPDFYLPDENKYIEITTLRQTLITKKHKKIRLFERYYPHLEIQLFDLRDNQQLNLHFAKKLICFGKPVKPRRPGEVEITRLGGRGANGPAVRANPAIAQVPKERP